MKYLTPSLRGAAEAIQTKTLFFLDCRASLAMTFRMMCLLVLLTPTASFAQYNPVPVSTDDVVIFAGGCFWCMESEFEDLKGVSDVTSGYAGGDGPKPTYEQVSGGNSGFIESVAITYDPSLVTYQQLLDIFWSNVDPFDAEGQFCDKGSQYTAAIFVKTPEEEKAAKASLAAVEKKHGKKVATKILPQTTFYDAEDHHQDYAKNNSVRYNLYKNGCGRPARLKKLQSR